MAANKFGKGLKTMPVTLDHIESFSRKTGLSNREADALFEKTGGDLFQVLTFLEEEGKIIFDSHGTATSFWQKILKKSNDAQIKIKRRQGTLLRIPLIYGIFGTAAFPRLVSLGILSLLLARCSLEMEWR